MIDSTYTVDFDTSDELAMSAEITSSDSHRSYSDTDIIYQHSSLHYP